MSYPGLNEFIAVVEEGSFTKAAEKLGSSKSRLSQQLTRLEKGLGVQLLHRSTRSMRLTEVGEQFYQQSKRGLQLIDQAIVQAQEDQHSLSGRIRINSVGGRYGEHIIAPIILRFMQQHPMVEIELDFASAHVDLISDQYDLAIRMGKLPDSNLIARPLQTLRSYICASPAYIKKYGKPETPQALNSGHACFYGSLRRWRFSKHEQQFEVYINGPMYCPNGHVQLQAALEGVALVRLPDIYVAPYLANGQLQPLLTDWQIESHPVSIVYPRARFKVRRVQALVEYIVSALKGS